MDHKQKSNLTPFQEKTPIFPKSNAKTLKNSFLFQKKHASCRVFSAKCTRNVAYLSKKERHSTFKNAAKNGIFAYKNRENDVFFPKKGTKIGLIREQGCLPMLFSTKGTRITTKPYVEIRKRYDVLCK